MPQKKVKGFGTVLETFERLDNAKKLLMKSFERIERTKRIVAKKKTKPAK